MPATALLRSRRRAGATDPEPGRHPAWLRPKLSRGASSAGAGWPGFIALFALIPYLRMNGKPLILLDVVPAPVHAVRDDVLPTDTVLLMLLLVGIFSRSSGSRPCTAVWWLGLPANRLMEFLYRPIERLIEGGMRANRTWIGAAGRSGGSSSTRSSWEFSMFLAHTFLAYFVGWRSCGAGSRARPRASAAFLVIATTTALMFLDFGWFREQCAWSPARMDGCSPCSWTAAPSSWATTRGEGEPRGTYGQRKTAGVEPPGRGRATAGARVMVAGDARVPAFGDCIDCGALRGDLSHGHRHPPGAQMECIHCTSAWTPAMP